MNESARPRVLLTGATGFIGRNSIVPLQRRGFDVHATCLDTPLPEYAGVTWHRADLLADDVMDMFSRIRPSHLLHFAWYAAPGAYWTSPENERWRDATKLILDAFARAGGRRAALAGTCAEYDWTLSNEVFKEDSPVSPVTLYGKCKNETREWAEMFAHERGVSLAWGRIFYLYGAHEAPARLIPSVISSLLRNEPALCSPGEQVRDYLFAADVGDAFAALLESGVEGAVNVASGEGVPVKDIVTMVGDLLEKPELIRLGARPAPNEPAYIVADTSRLNTEVDWRPRYSLKEGLLQTIGWWKENTARYRYSSQ